MWGDFWEFIAQRFVNNEFVIGYELINEPWAGNIWKNISLLAPGNAERVFLQKAYNYVSGRIRDIDDRHIIFFEPVTWDNIFPTGFSEPPGGPSYANRSIFSYHYYSPPDVTAQSTIYSSFKDSRFLNVGGMLTELAIQKDGAFPKSSVKAFKSCDRYRQSWILWTYKVCVRVYIFLKQHYTYIYIYILKKLYKFLSFHSLSSQHRLTPLQLVAYTIQMARQSQMLLAI
jgi:endoglycosylceramidase